MVFFYQKEEMKKRIGYQIYLKNTTGIFMSEKASQYLQYCTVNLLQSPNTTINKAVKIVNYYNYLLANKLTIFEILELNKLDQDDHFVEYRDYLFLSGTRNEKTCNQYLQEVFHFYTFLEEYYDLKGSIKVLLRKERGYINRVGLLRKKQANYFNGYFRVADNLRLKNELTKEDMSHIFEKCTNIRDELIVSVLADTGIRIGELLGLRREDIDIERRRIKIFFRENNENESRAKYGENRCLVFSTKTKELMQEYFMKYSNLLIKSEYLFVVLKGKTMGNPLKYTAALSMMKKISNKIGKEIYPHMFRHYFANDLRLNGFPIELISKALGHRKITTTEKYLNIRQEEVFEATEKYHQAQKGYLNIDSLI